MKLVWLMALAASGLAAYAAPISSPWEQPAASLAEQVVGILGPGQAHLTIRNLSSIPNGDVPAIRLLLEQDLKARGVLASGAESANTIRVTLSENLRERLWVAEVIEGNETRVTMVRVEPGVAQQAQAGSGLTLRKQTVLATREPVLAALETADSLMAVEPEEIVIYIHTADGWREQKRVGINQKRPLARDSRSVILPMPGGNGFEAALPGMLCSGSYQAAQTEGEWTVQCRESDDPWTLVHPPITQRSSTTQSVEAQATATEMDANIATTKAYYNAARNYFTGVVNSNATVDLPPFYSAAQVIRSTPEAALLIGGIDGRVQIADNRALKPVAGTRDWGSDFAVINSGCGAGMQIVASGSGEADGDSLRAYEIPAQEAIPASAAMAMEGSVTALWTAPDGKSLFAIVRSTADQYEVDRVTASCN